LRLGARQPVRTPGEQHRDDAKEIAVLLHGPPVVVCERVVLAKPEHLALFYST
jgi:hypothetical protein